MESSSLSSYLSQTGTYWVGGGVSGDSWVPVHLSCPGQRDHIFYPVQEQNASSASLA